MILNLTQHMASDSQRDAGVVEPVHKSQIQALITFSTAPSAVEMSKRVQALLDIIDEEADLLFNDADSEGELQQFEGILIGGAPFFMSSLERGLRGDSLKPLYSFSERVSEEKPQADGSVVKVNVFKHIGFIEPSDNY